MLLAFRLVSVVCCLVDLSNQISVLVYIKHKLECFVRVSKHRDGLKKRFSATIFVWLMTFPSAWFVTLFLFWNGFVVKIAHSQINGAGDTHVKAARMLFRKLELILWRAPIDIWFIWHLPLRSNKNRSNLLVLKNLSLITFFFLLFGFRFCLFFLLQSLSNTFIGISIVVWSSWIH